MKTGRALLIALELCLAWSLGACVPYAQAPLSDPEQAVIDTGLIGSWRSGDGGDRVYFHVGAADAHRLRILTVEHDRDGRLKTLEYFAHASSVGGRKYLNVVEQEREPSRHGYLLVRYRVEANGDVAISIPDLGVIKQAIQSGQLAGNVEAGEFGDALITAAPAATAAFLDEHQQALFAKEVTLHKLD